MFRHDKNDSLKHNVEILNEQQQQKLVLRASFAVHLKSKRDIVKIIAVCGPGEVSQWFRALVALSDDLGSVPDIHTTVHNCL